MEYYRAERVADRVTAIRSLTGEIMYLAEGEARAALIDTCLGVGHLRAFVERLTDKPLTVLLTHGHVDHAMGAPEFDSVYMNPKDIGMYRQHCPMDVRTGYIAGALGARFAELTEADYVPPTPEMAFLPLEDGMSFDLGGLHVDAVAFPGHTQGTMAFLIREPGLLVLGDACNNSTFLFDEAHSSTVEEYRDMVTEVRDRLSGRYVRALICHQQIDVDVDILDNMIDVCDDILAGRADDEPFEFMGSKAYIAKRCSAPATRADGKSGNLIYSKNHVRRGDGR